MPPMSNVHLKCTLLVSCCCRFYGVEHLSHSEVFDGDGHDQVGTSSNLHSNLSKHLRKIIFSF